MLVVVPFCFLPCLGVGTRHVAHASACRVPTRRDAPVSMLRCTPPADGRTACATDVPGYRILRIAARASASASRARSVSRLSCSFLPFANASSHLIFPRFK